MNTARNFLTLLLTLHLTACATPKASAGSSPFQRNDAAEQNITPGTGVALACCDLKGECYWVDAFSDCPFPWDVYYCEWGVTNLDGTVDCYD